MLTGILATSSNCFPSYPSTVYYLRFALRRRPSAFPDNGYPTEQTHAYQKRLDELAPQRQYDAHAGDVQL
ncbi:protein of unknown function [Acidithiobacillus ferrivorans]|uniref:Uncharacterized protein n=1 Tax=Acidithiobacillus ferrivorans TaxID=160808 RepID=A0A060URT0_9PROT|nr:hypothetical protein AFERRI_240123 [Acidithiobacillus ferrivorans]SMH64960.1 protein of unknown function [Acidithiobacillus ferrivorans]